MTAFRSSFGPWEKFKRHVQEIIPQRNALGQLNHEGEAIAAAIDLLEMNVALQTIYADDTFRDWYVRMPGWVQESFIQSLKLEAEQRSLELDWSIPLPQPRARTGRGLLWQIIPIAGVALLALTRGLNEAVGAAVLYGIGLGAVIIIRRRRRAR